MPALWHTKHEPLRSRGIADNPPALALVPPIPAQLAAVTTERDVLLRNISCLYHTAKAELARRTAEITNLRTELFTLSTAGGAHQQQQHLRGRPGQEQPRPPATRRAHDGHPPAPHALEGGSGRQGERAGWREAPREARAGPAVGGKRGRADGGELEDDGPASTRQRVEQQGRPLERGGDGGLGNMAREACKGGAARTASIPARGGDSAVDGAQRGFQDQQQREQQRQSQDRLEKRPQAEPLGMRRPGGVAEQLPAASQGQAAEGRGRGRGRDDSGVDEREERGRQTARHEQSLSGGCSGVRVRSGADGVGSREGRGEGHTHRDGSAECRGARSGGGADRERAYSRERERERDQERSGRGREKDGERDVRSGSKGDGNREREREREYRERKDGGSEREGARDWAGRQERGGRRDGGLEGNKENSGRWREGERGRGEERARS